MVLTLFLFCVPILTLSSIQRIIVRASPTQYRNGNETGTEEVVEEIELEEVNLGVTEVYIGVYNLTAEKAKLSVMKENDSVVLAMEDGQNITFQGMGQQMESTPAQTGASSPRQSTEALQSTTPSRAPQLSPATQPSPSLQRKTEGLPTNAPLPEPETLETLPPPRPATVATLAPPPSPATLQTLPSPASPATLATLPPPPSPATLQTLPSPASPATLATIPPPSPATLSTVQQPSSPAPLPTPAHQRILEPTSTQESSSSSVQQEVSSQQAVLSTNPTEPSPGDQSSINEIKPSSVPPSGQPQLLNSQSTTTAKPTEQAKETEKPKEPTESAENEGIEEMDCKQGVECYTQKDCGFGKCTGGRKCDCLSCPALWGCKSDKECGGFIEACDTAKGFCDCEKGAKAAGFKSFLDSLGTLCQLDCISNNDCYGLRCFPGTCNCNV